MTEPQLPTTAATFADHLAALPGVVGVTWRSGDRDDVDHGRWSLGLYFRGAFDFKLLAGIPGVASLADRAGADGSVTLGYHGSPVVVHLRDYDEVLHWRRAAERGHFEVHTVPGHVAGRPTYSLAAELVSDRVVAGSLEQTAAYPGSLSTVGGGHWRRRTASSLNHAELSAGQGDVAGVHGHLVRAAIEAAHARLCEAKAWTRNEIEILERAELTHLNQILTTLNTDPVTLVQRVMQARALLLD